MSREDIIKALIKERGMSLKSFSEYAGIPYTTLHSMLERGIGKASVDNVIKVCKALSVTVDELEKMTEYGSTYELETIAAHHDGDEWSQEELDEIEHFKAFVKARKAAKAVEKKD